VDGAAVQQLALRTAEELPGAVLEQPFGPDWDVHKVGGKIFLLTTDLRADAIITVKCRPEDGRSLREEHPAVTPGYHMDKRHWITVRGDDAITAELVEDLVVESYLLVHAGLPRRRRPLLPDHLVRLAGGDARR
jgi:predicted DNA-binding protein (MmcQ/YjbR family)